MVKPESFTKLPPLLTTTTKLNIECEPNATLPNENTLLDKMHEHNHSHDEDSEESLLEKIARKHYSYTTALGVTVGLGCLLLILNIVIFTAIYYQRRRKKKSRDRDAKENEINSDNFDNFSLTQLSISVTDKSPYTNSIHNSTTLFTKSPSIPEPPPPPKNMPPLPLVAVSPPKIPHKLNSCLSNSSTNVNNNSVKKRVQIQEISV